MVTMSSTHGQKVINMSMQIRARARHPSGRHEGLLFGRQPTTTYGRQPSTAGARERLKCQIPLAVVAVAFVYAPPGRVGGRRRRRRRSKIMIATTT